MAPFIARKHFPTLTILLVVLLGATFLARFLYERYLMANWSELAPAHEQAVGAELQRRFSGFERQAFADADAIAALPEMAGLLSLQDDSTQQAYFFDRVAPRIPGDLTVEVYDRDGELIGWSGPRGPAISFPQPGRERISVVVQDPIYSYLMVVVPIVVHESLRGYVAGRKLIEVNYPVNNRFVNSKGFSGTFATSLPWPVEFEFPSDPALSGDSLRIPVELKNLAGKPVGDALIPRQTLSSESELVDQYAVRAAGLFAVGLALVLLIWTVTLPRIRNSPLLLLLSGTAALWAFRYLLVWLDFPGSYISWSIFDPMKFASPFGWGIAKSNGDMFISSVTLALNALLAARMDARRPAREWMPAPAGGRRQGGGAAAARAAVSILIVLVLAGVVRAFAAAIQSAVLDADLPYNDLTFVIPSLDLAVMLLSMIVIAFSMVTVAVLLCSMCWSLVRTGRSRSAFLFRLIWLLVLVVVVSLFFGRLQQNPLVTPVERFLYLAGFALATLAVFLLDRRQGGSMLPFVLVFCGAVVALVPMLDEKAHALDRLHVELLASDLAQPADSWFTLLVRRSLAELTGKEAANTLRHGDSLDLHALAFTQWAKSTLGEEGNNCSVTYVNPEGEVVSDFHIGIPPHASIKHLVEEKAVNGRLVKWYVGYASVQSAGTGVVGGVRIEVSGTRQSILGGEAPEFLRSGSREGIATRYRPLILSEYYRGKLLSTTGETIPLTRSLPAAVPAQADEPGRGIWIEETIGGDEYESFYFPELSASHNEAWLSLSMPVLGARWHMYTFLRYIIFYLLLAALVLAIVVLARIVRGGHISPSFRLRLLAAFVIVSLIPVVILVYYNRQLTREQTDETTAKHLSEQTMTVVSEIREELTAGVPAELAQLRDDQCAEIADAIDVDFNVYYGPLVQASSKPEMFTAELMDPRLSAAAYREIVLQRKKFFFEYQRIGTLPYVVGYRPLVAEDGSVMGVVSVPTLYRQIEINQDLARRNVFLYGAYAIALALSVVVGTTFANQISRPIRRLTAATRQIAAGELDVQLSHRRMDEFGQLEQAFLEMTGELRRAQDQMMKAQRELAWREMAKQVAHEIKNPLTPMKLSLQHMRQAYQDGVQDFGALLERVSDTLLEQIEALSRIASEFSHFARMPERVLRSCLVNDVLLEAKNLFQEQGSRFRVELDPALPVVRADREELRRAFINLIRNAMQAVGERNGTITLSTRKIDGSVEICVRDNGPGIPPEIYSRLFEPNFSTKTDGMGLGLPIVKRIVDELGGTIRVESTPAAGTAITLLLPVLEEG